MNCACEPAVTEVGCVPLKTAVMAVFSLVPLTSWMGSEPEYSLPSAVLTLASTTSSRSTISSPPMLSLPVSLSIQVLLDWA